MDSSCYCRYAAVLTAPRGFICTCQRQCHSRAKAPCRPRASQHAAGLLRRGLPVGQEHRPPRPHWPGSIEPPHCRRSSDGSVRLSRHHGSIDSRVARICADTLVLGPTIPPLVTGSTTRPKRSMISSRPRQKVSTPCANGWRHRASLPIESLCPRTSSGCSSTRRRANWRICSTPSTLYTRTLPRAICVFLVASQSHQIGLRDIYLPWVELELTWRPWADIPCQSRFADTSTTSPPGSNGSRSRRRMRRPSARSRVAGKRRYPGRSTSQLSTFRLLTPACPSATSISRRIASRVA